MKSLALPRRLACSARSSRIAWALAKVNSSTKGSWIPSKILSRQRIFPDVGRVTDDPVHARMPPTRGRRGCALVA